MSPVEVLTLRPAYPLYWMVPLAGAAVFGAFVAYGFTYKPLRLRTRFALTGLRLGAVLTVIGCIAGPVWSRTETIVEKGTAMIALDASRSMMMRDSAGKTRREIARRALGDCRRAIEDLAERLDLKTLTFALGVTEGPLDVSAEGATTDIAKLLDHVSRAGGVDCAGVVLISDGRDTAGGDVLREASRLGKTGVPVYAVGVGEDRTPEDFLDVRIESPACPEKAFVRNRMTVTADLVTVLPATREVKVTFSVDGERVGDAVVARRGSGRRTKPLSFEYVPEALGIHRAEILVEPVEGERNVENNVVRTFFRVFGSRLGVLYLEGALRWEFKYVRRTLAGAPNVDLRAVQLFREGQGLLPKTDEEWKALKILILGDVPASRLDAAAVARIPDFVEKGGALLVIGGRRNLGPGGYGSTPLRTVMPVAVTAGDAPVEGPLDIRLTADGRRHPVCRVADDPDLSEKLWGQLPELDVVFGVSGTKDVATTLLSAGPRRPLLVMQDYGSGRSAVFLADETWRWRFAEKAYPELHKRFWRQLVAHLAHNDYGERGKAILVETDRMRYMLSEKTALSAWVAPTNPEGDARADLAEAKAVARVELPNGTEREIELGTGAGQHSTALRLNVPGEYVVTARLLSAKGEELGSDETRFAVVEIDLEDENPAADLALMAEIAKLSGGEYFAASGLPAALERVKSRNVSTVKTVERTEAVWNTPWAAALFILLLSAEWALRKRAGLA